MPDVVDGCKAKGAIPASVQNIGLGLLAEHVRTSGLSGHLRAPFHRVERASEQHGRSTTERIEAVTVGETTHSRSTRESAAAAAKTSRRPH